MKTTFSLTLQRLVIAIGHWHVRIDFPCRTGTFWLGPSFQTGWRCEFMYTGWCLQLGFWYCNWIYKYRFDYIE